MLLSYDMKYVRRATSDEDFRSLSYDRLLPLATFGMYRQINCKNIHSFLFLSTERKVLYNVYAIKCNSLISLTM